MWGREGETSILPWEHASAGAGCWPRERSCAKARVLGPDCFRVSQPQRMSSVDKSLLELRCGMPARAHSCAKVRVLGPDCFCVFQPWWVSSRKAFAGIAFPLSLQKLHLLPGGGQRLPLGFPQGHRDHSTQKGENPQAQLEGLENIQSASWWPHTARALWESLLSSLFQFFHQN